MEKYEDLRSGMINNVSVAYGPIGPIKEAIEYKSYEEGEEGPDGEKIVEWTDFITFKKFEFLEASLVSIPADQDVGMGRSASAVEELRKLKRGGTEPMDEDDTQDIDPEGDEDLEDNDNIDPEDDEDPSGGGDPDDDRGSGDDDEDEDDEDDKKKKAKHAGLMRKVSKSAKKFGLLKKDLKELEERTEGVTDPDKFYAEVTAMVREKTKERSKLNPNLTRGMHTRKHIVSLSRFIESASNGGFENGMNGIEGDFLEEFKERNEGIIPSRSNSRSFFVPFTVMARDENFLVSMVGQRAAKEIMEGNARAVTGSPWAVGTPGTDSGFYTPVFDETWFIPALIAEARLLTKVTKPSGELTQDRMGIRETGEMTVSHTAEAGMVSDTDGTLSYGNVSANWHQINVATTVNQRALDQSTYFYGRLLANAMKEMFRGQNRVLIGKQGQVYQTNSPEGLLSITGRNMVSLGADANSYGTPDYADVQILREMLEAKNLPMGNCCYVMTPEIIGTLGRTARFKSSQGDVGDKIIEYAKGDVGRMGYIDGWEVLPENNLPKTLPKGNKTGNNAKGHAMMFGDFSTIEWLLFSGVEMFIDPYSQSNVNKVVIRFRNAYEFFFNYPTAAFVFIEDAIPSKAIVTP